MSPAPLPSSQDQALEEAFGASLSDLSIRASDPDATAVLPRALEMRHFLALAEKQVIRVRDRVHEATSADGDLDELSSENLRMDAQWLDAALSARTGYISALKTLLREVPASDSLSDRPVGFTQVKTSTTLPLGPGPASAETPREHRR